jgi:hypothetical protein
MRSTLAVLAAAVALVAGANILHRQPTRQPAAPPPTAPIILGGKASSVDRPSQAEIHARARRSERDAPPRSRQPSASATLVARRFLGAFLVWQDGNASPPIVRTLRSTSAASLWRLLSSARGEPARNPRVTAERVQRLTPGVPSGGVSTVLAQLQARSGLEGGLALVLRKERGSWRVVSLGR